MATPLSLQANPDYFANWVTPRGEVPEGMLWCECINPGMEPSMQASVNQPAAARMSFFTPWSNFAQYNDDILLSILGGYDHHTSMMAPPMGWIYGDDGDLFATDVSITTATIDNSVSWVAGFAFPYQWAIYNITFQSLPYLVNNAQTDEGYNPNWLEFKSQATNETFQSPAGFFIFTTPAPAGIITNSSVLGSLNTFGSNFLEVVAHRIPSVNAFSGGFGNPLLQSWLGYVNDAPIFGCDTNTLLFDSFSMQPFGDWQGNLIFDIHMFFNQRGNADIGNDWQSALAIDGNWYPIVTKDGGNMPFTQNHFQTMLTGLIPAQE